MKETLFSPKLLFVTVLPLNHISRIKLEHKLTLKVLSHHIRTLLHTQLAADHRYCYSKQATPHTRASIPTRLNTSLYQGSPVLIWGLILLPRLAMLIDTSLGHALMPV